MAERGRVAESTAVRPKLRPGARKTLIVVAVWAVVWAFLLACAAHNGFFDLKVYYGAMDYWVNRGGDIYDYLTPGTPYGFTYPPLAAMLMTPMSLIGWNTAIVVSVTMNVLAMVAILTWLLRPIFKRQGWNFWFAMGIAAALAAAFEPVRETVNFGQVNILLLFLVVGDVLVLVRGGSRLGGLGIGLATAIKLTPGIFIVYLLVTRRWRAAAVSAATATAATWAAATLAPDASRVFWTDAVWNTDRVGSPTFVSNQALTGLVGRIFNPDPMKPLWLLLVLITLAVWYWRTRRAIRNKDEVAGLALTGIVGCMVSPITWIHHLVWVLPSIVVLFDYATDRSLDPRRRRNLMIAFGFSFALLCSRTPWAFHAKFDGLGLIGGNAYILLMIVLLFALPIREPADSGAGQGLSADPGRSTGPAVEDVPDLVDLDRKVSAAFDAKDVGGTVRSEAGPNVEPARPLVGA
ncbi:glycosyltransferase 87 family protein [Dactylosporangium sp. CA-139066]|uniref:glycosyltransferase 87 family protein n=1 Tax=Dactylosporangium sp. CA-139066 TaxID=3239930 RepID=UPI003D94536F